MTALSALSSRSAALPLFLGAAAAGFGLGFLGLAASLPPRVADPLPPPQARTPSEAVTADTDEAIPVADWAPVFGVPAPEPVEPPPPEPEPEPQPVNDEPFFDHDAYRLQGLVVEDGRGWALLESDEGVALFRVGDVLPGGEQLVAIEDDGIEVEVDGAYFFIGFEDADDYQDPYDPDDFDHGDDEGAPPPGATAVPSFGGGRAPLMEPVGTGRVGQ
jgi:hypothetical protein